MYFIDIENIDVPVLDIKPESWTVEEERETQLRDGVEVFSHQPPVVLAIFFKFLIIHSL